MAIERAVRPDFGFAFDSRTRYAGLERHKFPRTPGAFIENCLPTTYGIGPGTVEVRMLTPHTEKEAVGAPSSLAPFFIGERGVRQLQELEIAEITVHDIQPDIARRALELLSSNWERLATPPRGEEGIHGFLTTDHIECVGFVEGTARLLSTRLDGERGMIITEYEMGEASYRRMPIEVPGVQRLFSDLGLMPPQRNIANNPVVQFDILRVFNDGGLYSTILHMPFELALAQSVQV